MIKNEFVSGEWNVTCDSCSAKIKSSKAQHRWDGFIVCPECWEPRQSLDFLKARSDKITVPFTRPIPPLTFVTVVYGNMYLDSGWIVDGYFVGTEL